MGTHTSGAQQDYLQIATVQIPNQVQDEDVVDEDDDTRIGREAYDDERGGKPFYSQTESFSKILVLRARGLRA